MGGRRFKGRKTRGRGTRRLHGSGGFKHSDPSEGSSQKTENCDSVVLEKKVADKVIQERTKMLRRTAVGKLKLD